MHTTLNTSQILFPSPVTLAVTKIKPAGYLPESGPRQKLYFFSLSPKLRRTKIFSREMNEPDLFSSRGHSRFYILYIFPTLFSDVSSYTTVLEHDINVVEHAPMKQHP